MCLERNFETKLLVTTRTPETLSFDNLLKKNEIDKNTIIYYIIVYTVDVCSASTVRQSVDFGAQRGVPHERGLATARVFLGVGKNYV